MSKRQKTKVDDFDRAVDWEQIAPILRKAIHEYEGDIGVLESAIGALFVGLTMGWQVLHIVHGRTTYKKYEGILKIRFRDVCKPRGVWSAKSRGLDWADKIGSFWEAVKSAQIPRHERGKSDLIKQ